MPKRQQKSSSRKQDADKVAAKKARRAERQEQDAEQRALEARKARTRRVLYGAAGVLAVAFVGLLLFNQVKPGPEIEGVERPSNLGSGHVDPSESVNYPTPTPTSGAHSVSSARCGLITDGLPLEFAVHSLEHGVVVVWYRPDLEENLLPDLQVLLGQWDSHVIVAPNPGISEPIVATAWNRLQRFEDVGQGLSEFIDVYRQRGPESVPCDI